ncbi:helix-turn-helix transcriptional regulator [Prescottella agglutinans]|uniref:Excisionase family DNA binding protein n=1 Tax=Prescottella agglutinans TaxID=1644129 RepID=A0ABT6MED5_9NOCA|nr:helix-turn-helix domain-containing protein [Prescottella agglutinans]MDH6282595.1 excisionase family DNA binding protein [Prescottella agglutinans]
MSTSERSPLATPQEVANYLHTTTASLAQLRYKGGGIPFCKVGGRRVLYRWADVEAYIESRLMTRTDDRPGAA